MQGRVQEKQDGFRKDAENSPQFSSISMSSSKSSQKDTDKIAL
jgi:hypothetical protein